MNRCLTLPPYAAFAATLAALVVLSASPGRAPGAPVPSVQVKAPEGLTEINGYLLLNRKVLRDMKCDIDQLDKIFDIMEEAEAKTQQLFKEYIQTLLAQGGNFNQQAVMDTLEKAGKEMNKAVERVEKELLTPAQRKRLQEIDLQQRGYFALSVPAVAKVLELTPKQKEQLEENAKKVSEELSQLTPTPPGLPGLPRAIRPGAIDSEKQEKERVKIRAEGLKRAVAGLTETQQAVWKKLVGAPVAYSLDTNTRTQGPVFFGGGFGGGLVPVMPALPIPPVVIPPPAVPPKPAPKPPAKD